MPPQYVRLLMGTTTEAALRILSVLDMAMTPSATPGAAVLPQLAYTSQPGGYSQCISGIMGGAEPGIPGCTEEAAQVGCAINATACADGLVRGSLGYLTPMLQRDEPSIIPKDYGQW